jgi:small conductance mechanosensitive channel
MQIRELDKSLAGFLESLLKIALQTFVVIATINQLGVATTSIVAVLGAAGLAVGLALSGTLQNFAGGAMILMFKPFKVGDFIEAQGHSGTVKAIQIFVTTLTTPDNKVIIVPNGPLSNGSLINYSAKQTIREILEADERTLKEKSFTIELAAMADSSLNIVARVWVNSSDYWDVHYAVNTAVFKAFNQKGISIPYPQMDVHLHK